MVKAKTTVSAAPTKHKETRLHIRASEADIARYKRAQEKEHFRDLTAWVLKTLDDRCDALGL